MHVDLHQNAKCKMPRGVCVQGVSVYGGLYRECLPGGGYLRRGIYTEVSATHPTEMYSCVVSFLF